MNEIEKNNKMLIIIILLIVVILGLVLFICYDKGVFNDKTINDVFDTNKENELENKKEMLALDDLKFFETYEALKTFTYKNNKEKGSSSFTDDELNLLCTNSLVSSDFSELNETTQWGDKYYSFNSKKCDDVVKKYLGDEANFNKNGLVGKSYEVKGNFPAGNGLIIESFDASSNVYKVRFSGLGGVMIPTAKIEGRKIVSAELIDEEITIIEKVIFVNNNASYDNNIVTYNICSDADCKNVIDVVKYSIEDGKNKVIRVDDYLDKAGNITHKFKLNKNTNTYYFTSSIIK